MYRSKNLFLIALMVTFLLLTGCGRQTLYTSNTPNTKEVQITEEGGACGSGVGLNTGDTLDLILEGDPSSGYIWEVGFYVPEVIKPENDTNKQSDSNQDSADGTQTFRFVATGEGQATLVMLYHNPFEKDSSDLKTCEVTVDVK